MKLDKILSIIFIFTTMAFSQIVFESPCRTLDEWDTLDMEGDGQIRVLKDFSVPPGFGPNVIEMAGKNIVMLAKNQELQNGTLLVLWKDMEPQKNDADGILLFRADLPQDISLIHNTKRTFAQYWIEQDFDSGTSIRYKDESIPDKHIALAAGKGLTYDTRWNPTGWFWQKVQFKDENIKVKFWSVTQKEPDEWALSGTDDARHSGRFGVRGWSAKFRVAHFQASTNDIKITPPSVMLFTPELEIFSSNAPSFELFLNANPANKNLKIIFTISQKNKKLYSGEWTKQNTNHVKLIAKNDSVNKPQIYLDFPKVEKQLPFIAEVVVKDAYGNLLGSDNKTLIFRSNDALVKKISQLEKRAQKQLIESQSNNDLRTKAASQAAKDLLALANERIESGQIDHADKDINYAQQLLTEQTKLPHAIQHAGDFSLRFKKVELSSASFVTGEKYEANILWQVKDGPVNRDLTFRFDLCNQYGLSSYSFISNPAKSTKTWKAGEYQQKVQFEIPPQIDGDSSPPPLPKVYSDDYFFCVTVSDSTQKDIYPWMLLDNPESIRFFRLGQKYVLAPVYVTFEPIEIADINLSKTKVLEKSNLQIKLDNLNSEYSDLRCAVQIETKAGTILYQNNKIVDVSKKREIPIEFEWTPDYAGSAKILVKIFKDNRLLTKAVKDVEIAAPNGIEFTVERSNVIPIKEPFLTQLKINLDLAKKHSYKNISFSVRNGTKELATKTLSLKSRDKNLSTDLKVEPNWGYYFVQCKLSSKNKSFFLEKRIVATVVETRDGKIFVNGEPFIMKGTNVHGLYGHSRELSGRAMEIMKDYGYNTLRGDHPNLWLVELAEEKNMVWMALNEFSCASTDEVFERFDSEPIRGIQEISRQFITAYRDHAGMLFWNSCNEIGNDLDEFLIALYPCFKIHDPYNRPVNYANLYGQDNWRGQDIMGINYYFDRGQRAADRQPIIEKSIQVGKQHNLPVVYTEFNSFQGCSEGPGLEAIRDMGEWGLKAGMSGGTHYKLTDVKPIHPGLLDPNGRLEVHKPIGEQVKAYHADATVKLLSKEKNNLVIEIQNKRNFYLRNMSIELHSGKSIWFDQQLSDISPNEKKKVVLEIANKNIKTRNEFAGKLIFTTHSGLENRIDIRLFNKAE